LPFCNFGSSQWGMSHRKGVTTAAVQKQWILRNLWVCSLSYPASNAHALY